MSYEPLTKTKPIVLVGLMGAEKPASDAVWRDACK